MKCRFPNPPVDNQDGVKHCFHYHPID
jgi:hypothetical protein